MTYAPYLPDRLERIGAQPEWIRINDQIGGAVTTATIPKSRSGANGAQPRKKRDPVDVLKAPKGRDAVNILPGLRDRIIAEMDESTIPPEDRLKYLCMMTGSAPQTARRWLAEDKPGLPDLKSFAQLCIRFDADANWMLGLTQLKYSLPKEQLGNAHPREPAVDWLHHITRQIADEGPGCETWAMPGDDMEPRIKNGAPILVDLSITEITGNGTYLLEYQGRTLVRHVEVRIGEGLVLTCANTQYKATMIKDGSTAKKMGLKVLGRLRLAIAIDKL